MASTFVGLQLLPLQMDISISVKILKQKGQQLMVDSDTVAMATTHFLSLWCCLDIAYVSLCLRKLALSLLSLRLACKAYTGNGPI